MLRRHWRSGPCYARVVHCRRRHPLLSPTLTPTRDHETLAVAAPGAAWRARPRFPGTSTGQTARLLRVRPTCPGDGTPKAMQQRWHASVSMLVAPAMRRKGPAVRAATYHLVELLDVDTVCCYCSQHTCTHVLDDGLARKQRAQHMSTSTPNLSPATSARTESTMPPMSAPDAGVLDTADDDESALSTPLLNVPNRFCVTGAGAGPVAPCVRPSTLQRPVRVVRQPDSRDAP